MIDDIFFVSEDNEDENSSKSLLWNILIVDDDDEVHAVTKLALTNFEFDNKKLNLVSAYSAKEAKSILSKNNDFGIVFLDIVMESNDAGLEVIDHIRGVLSNSFTRIIIRTGQPGYAPEQDVINRYDINDYKEKTELTVSKLYTTTRTALAQYRQIIELENKKNEIYDNMIKDTMTGLFSRNKLYMDLKQSKNAGIILIDIDSFNTINKAYGYDFGDEILVKFANILKDFLKEESKVYRIESDKFVALFENKSDEELKQIAFTLKSKISEYTFEIDEMILIINTSIGIANYPNDDLIHKVEIAINAAREKQHHKIEIYSEEIDTIKKINHNIYWSKILSHAICTDNIYTYYQPIVDCKTEKIVKYESLVRLRHENKIYSPYSFLTAANKAGLLSKITKIVFEHSCKTFKNNNYEFSINISNVDLMDINFTDFVLECSKRYDINPARVSFEILENSNINRNAQIKSSINDLKNAGFLISIDDFGIENSNFSQLHNLEVDHIKIDGSFIKNIVDDKNSFYITKTIVAYTKNINVKTIAEFVHSKEVFEKIKELGIDYAQGYYFGTPQEKLVEL